MFGIGSGNYNLVGNHIAFSGGIESYLRYGSVTHHLGISVDSECHGLTELHLAYVGLIDISHNLHVVKVGDYI